jgi:hypothetical protein
MVQVSCNICDGWIIGEQEEKDGEDGEHQWHPVLGVISTPGGELIGHIHKDSCCEMEFKRALDMLGLYWKRDEDTLEVGRYEDEV